MSINAQNIISRIGAGIAAFALAFICLASAMGPAVVPGIA